MLFRWFSLKDIHITKPILIKDLVFVIRQPQMKAKLLSCGIMYTEPNKFSHKKAGWVFVLFFSNEKIVCS